MDRQNYEQVEETTNLRTFTPLLLLVQVLGILVIILVAVWTGHYLGGFGWSEDVQHQFNYHPLFMVIGLVVVYGNATLVYRVFRRENKLFIKCLHAFLNMSAFILAVVALVAVFNNHNTLGFANLYSLHSWMGLATVIMFSIQFALGFSFYLFPKLSLPLRQKYMPFHRYFGAAIFAGATATALMGITEKMIFDKARNHYDEFSAEGLLVNLLGLLLVGLAGCVLFLLVNPDYRRVPLPEEEMIHLQPE